MYSASVEGGSQNLKQILVKFLAISGNSKHFSCYQKKTKKLTPPQRGGQGGPQSLFSPRILIFLWLKTPCNISKPYDNPFWGENNGGRKRERKNSVNSGHFVLWQRMQDARAKIVTAQLNLSTGWKWQHTG